MIVVLICSKDTFTNYVLLDHTKKYGFHLNWVTMFPQGKCHKILKENENLVHSVV
jgi:hypothetical protein